MFYSQPSRIKNLTTTKPCEFLSSIVTRNSQVVPVQGDKLFYIQISFGVFYTILLIDTGAFSTAMAKVLLQKIQRLSPEAIIKFYHQFSSIVRFANGQKTEVFNSVTIAIRIADSKLEEEFLILKYMNSPLLGNPFFKKDNIALHPHRGLSYLSDFTLGLNDCKSNRTGKKLLILFTQKKSTLKSNHPEIVHCQITDFDDSVKESIGINESCVMFEKKTGLCFMSSISNIDAVGKTKIGIINLMPSKTTISARTQTSKIQILTTKQAAYLLPIHPSILEKQKNFTSLNRENK